MKKSVELKQQRAAKLTEARGIIDAAKAEKRDLTAEESVTVASLEAEIDDLETRAEQAEAQERIELRLARDKGSEESSEQKELKPFNLMRALNHAAAGKPLEGLEREMQDEGEKEYRESGVTLEGGARSLLLPQAVLRSMYAPAKRDMTVTGGSPAGVEGGYNVPTEVDNYITALRQRNLLLSLGAGMMNDLSGNIDMPRENAVAALAWEGETDETAETSPTYTKVQFAPKRLAGFVDVSRQLLLQNSTGVQARVSGQILDAVATALDIAGFAGPGSGGSPTGIIYDADVPVHAIGTNGGALTRAAILAMEELLGEGFAEGNPLFITTNPNRRKLKSTAVDAGSGLFLWDRMDNSVEGYGAFATTHLPKNLTKGSGTALSAAILGAISAQNMSFGQWGGLEILVNPYTKAKSGMVEMVINAYLDFHVLRPGALAVCKDIVTT
jgi:HK97 family phage major capsid protein